jgi:type VI protein secretion system component VasF
MSFGKILRLPNTLAFRLTLWFAGIFALCSCVAFLLFYALITTVLQERTDQELLHQA